MMKVLVTGAAGFIGAHLTRHLKSQGFDVVAVDRMSDYYSTDLKKLRLSELLHQKVDFRSCDLGDFDEILDLIREIKPETVFHLAAQPGIRLPLTKYSNYINDNLLGFQNLLTAVVESEIPNFIYASSSSVYGNSGSSVLSEKNSNLLPISYYGKTKLINEFTADLVVKGSATRARGLRFFTVYGPSGRPDMAYFRLIGNALQGIPFTLFGDGSTLRDFTYVEDVIVAIDQLGVELKRYPLGHADVVNVGGGNPVSMNQLIDSISKITGKPLSLEKSKKNANDVDFTCAEVEKQLDLINWKPSTSLEYGLNETIAWMSSDEVTPKLKDWISGS